MQDDKPTRTKKKSRIILKANISTPGEVELLKNIHYDGVGLLRSEFILTSDDKVPTEDEWFNIYRNVLESVKGKQVVIRLLDIGGDKMPGYIKLPEQENPDLGIRGARALSLFYEIYLRQIRAILRASNHGDLSILYPMVSDASDVEDYREILRVSKKQLCEEKIPFNNSIKEGIMIETPSAAIMADSLLEIVDFANIGSNDLIQYTLAASRGNQLIEKRYHILHPSLVRLMENIVKAGKNHKKEICLCGEIAGFEEYYPLFLGIGLRSFSVSASQLDAIKCYLISADKADIKLVNRFYKARTKEDIDKVFAQK